MPIIENLKNNSGANRYSNWNKKFTIGIQGRFEQAEERIRELEDKTMEHTMSEKEKEKGKKSSWSLKDP